MNIGELIVQSSNLTSANYVFASLGALIAFILVYISWKSNLINDEIRNKKDQQLSVELKNKDVEIATLKIPLRRQIWPPNWPKMNLQKLIKKQKN